MTTTPISPNSAAQAPVLVTGGTGYLGVHTVVRLLSDGYRVRATVRDLDRTAELHAAVAKGGISQQVVDDRLEVVAADLTADAGWPEATAGCSHVLHVASPFYTVDLEHQDTLIGPARDGSLRVLRAARDAGVQRVVLTSSFAAVGYSPKPGNRYDESDWTNPADTESAYVRSKAIAEAAAWDFVRSEGDGLELTVINPTGIFGPVLTPRLSSSVALVKAMLEGKQPLMPRLYFGVADVRDLAALHVRAMTEPKAAGERFLATSGEAISYRQLSEILAERLGPHFGSGSGSHGGSGGGSRGASGGGSGAGNLPITEMTDDQVREAAKTIPALRDAVSRLGVVPEISTAKARALLDWAPRDIADTLVDTAESLQELLDFAD